ncbi:tRNA 2-thiouridine(34) synthase MnmA [bacterium]|nr:tRNA 2-thiouridine(34) synthase MnmA [bacterium]MCI0566499.1 tRNA 2-thiouridine(34) synthase MnmA [bacterium]
MKIAMLLSGGVDSSVSLALLKEKGFDVNAFYLKIWLEDELSSLNNCPWEDDLRYARAVCEKLDVPLEVIPLQKEYNEKIIAYTVSEARAGRTPNPDVLCNPRIKFGAFFDAVGKKFDKIATGHYAQAEKRDGITYLKKSADKMKDQTYFLSQLSQEQLSRAIFPIGHLAKNEVRALAKKYTLPNAERKDSQGLCFLGKIKFDEFLRKHLGTRNGDLIELETGKKIGEHNGFWFYTIGQRHGIRLSGGPWYVAEKNAEKNIVSISNSKTNEEDTGKNFLVRNIHWVADMPAPDNLTVKIRHGERETPCTIKTLPDGALEVSLKKPESGVASGQFAVFYNKEYCLGGGVIA